MYYGKIKDVSAIIIYLVIPVLGLLWKVEAPLIYNHTFRKKKKREKLIDVSAIITPLYCQFLDYHGKLKDVSAITILLECFGVGV